jgi:hypothetical protein
MNKTIRRVLMALCVPIAFAALAPAQDTTPKRQILQIDREFVKPGKAGALHDKSESAFVAAMTRAKWPSHYIAYQSMTGKNRVLYIEDFDSFAAWEKDSKAMAKNPALTAELDHAGVVDGELLDSSDQLVLMSDPDLSLRSRADISKARYLEIESFKIKPGQEHSFEDLAKYVISIHQQAGTTAHWGMYELVFGGEGPVYAVFTARDSLAEIDAGFAEGKKFEQAAGEEGMKKIREMAASCIEKSDSELFSVNPKQSYPPDEFVKADPDFWKPKPAAAPAAMTAAPAKKTTP